MLEKQKSQKNRNKKIKRDYHFPSKDTLEKAIQVKKAGKICQNRKIEGIGASV